MGYQIRAAKLVEIIRFYQAALVNTAFGLGVFMVLIYFGVELYLSQIVSHVIGTSFNYFTYSRHVFRDASPAKTKFLFAYIGNYLLGLAVLYIVRQFVVSPYIAGLFTVAITSIINFLVLKYAVFNKNIPNV